MVQTEYLREMSVSIIPGMGHCNWIIYKGALNTLRRQGAHKLGTENEVQNKMKKSWYDGDIKYGSFFFKT